MVKLEDVLEAHRKLESAMDELVKLASQHSQENDGMPASTVAGYILAVDNRFIDSEGKLDGYISYYDPMAGQPEHISRMILRDALEISESRNMAGHYSGDDDD
ncbi:hypothetical protein SEA_KEELAN_121 [Gordonia phage Keelan]|nr:hypothetical protein SEA_KEELAN_121 [Gordonia phage Keelan]